MPILTSNPVEIFEPEIPYQRLAFRGSFTANINKDKVTKSELALHVTKYRKVSTSTGTEIEEVGSSRGIRGITMSKGDNAIDDALMERIAKSITSSMSTRDTEVDVQVNFNWRIRDDDIIGLVQATVTTVDGEVINIASPDVAAWDQEYPEFAVAYSDALKAISDWVTAKGW